MAVRAGKLIFKILLIFKDFIKNFFLNFIKFKDGRVWLVAALLDNTALVCRAVTFCMCPLCPCLIASWC